ncbi:LOL2-like protein [Drosera capensis]
MVWNRSWIGTDGDDQRDKKTGNHQRRVNVHDLRPRRRNSSPATKPPRFSAVPFIDQFSGMRSQIVCNGCRSLLLYPADATNVRCAVCQTITPVQPTVATISCASCHTALMYPIGAASVKCAVCQYITPVGAANLMAPIPGYRPNGAATPSVPSSSAPSSNSQTQTVVVENPMSVDESGKLVSNVVVGVTTGKK